MTNTEAINKLKEQHGWEKYPIPKFLPEHKQKFMTEVITDLFTIPPNDAGVMLWETEQDMGNLEGNVQYQGEDPFDWEVIITTQPDGKVQVHFDGKITKEQLWSLKTFLQDFTS